VIGDTQCPAPVAAIDVAFRIFGSAVEQIIDDFAVLGPQRVGKKTATIASFFRRKDLYFFALDLKKHNRINKNQVVLF